MGKLNMSRVILGGIVAGIVSDVLGFLVDGVLLAPRWAAGMKALGRPDFTTNQWIWFNLIGIAGGIFALWLYAAIRPRYGPGPKTAIWAGLAVWFAMVLLPNATLMWAGGLFSSHLTLLTTLGGVVEWLAGTVVGAALYKEATS